MGVQLRKVGLIGKNQSYLKVESVEPLSRMIV